MKYGAVFVGPGTLFKNAKGSTVQPTNAQGVEWIVGDDALATMHSEPPFVQPRIFCSVLPCKRAQCDQIWPDTPSVCVT